MTPMFIVLRVTGHYKVRFLGGFQSSQMKEKRENRKPLVNKFGSFGKKKIEEFCFETLVRQNMTLRARGRNGKDF